MVSPSCYQLPHLESPGFEPLFLANGDSSAGTSLRCGVLVLLDRTAYLNGIIEAVENADAAYYLGVAVEALPRDGLTPEIVEAGHVYKLPPAAGDGFEVLTFIRRSSRAVSHPSEHSGTNSQALMRALIRHAFHTCAADDARDDVVEALRMAMLCCEGRAFRRKIDKVNRDSRGHTSFRERDRDLPFDALGYRGEREVGIENLPIGSDGHVRLNALRERE